METSGKNNSIVYSKEPKGLRKEIQYVGVVNVACSLGVLMLLKVFIDLENMAFFRFDEKH